MAKRGMASGCAKDVGDEVVGEDGGDLNCLPIIPRLGLI